MASTTKPAPTSVDVAALAIRIQEKLVQADELLKQAAEDASDLVNAATFAKVERFHLALGEEAQWIADYLGPDHAGSGFDIDSAVKSIEEFLELLGYADRKDG
jgi:hypothetical protein